VEVEGQVVCKLLKSQISKRLSRPAVERDPLNLPFFTDCDSKRLYNDE
jgi:hypothetical protein